MLIIGWIVVGFVSGFIASKIVNREGEGFVARRRRHAVRGFIFAGFGAAGVTGFDPHSMLVSIVGAINVRVFYQAMFPRRTILLSP
jgi:uncharacterized membrane protein YeaQ/YmgE (transglycosylase-associated protein family)